MQRLSRAARTQRLLQAGVTGSRVEPTSMLQRLHGECKARAGALFGGVGEDEVL